MVNKVRHGKRLFKQMALEVAVRNPDRYEGILKSFAKYDGVLLDDYGILDVYSQLFLDDVLSAEKLKNIKITKNYLRGWIKENCSHMNPAKRNVLDLKNETCKNREKRNVLKISHTRHSKAIKKQSVLGCFYGF